jgi:RNA polymerase sigma-70 factor (ECF subfamily)
MDALLRREEVDCLDSLLEKYRGHVWRLAYRFVQDADEAQDVTQDVLLTLCREAARLEPETRLAAWLTRVTSNAALNAGRGRATRRRYHQAAAAEPRRRGLDPEAGLVGMKLRRALAALPRGQRAAVTLRLLEEKTFREIAETFGVTEGTVKVQFARGLRRLRLEMEENRSERS